MYEDFWHATVLLPTSRTSRKRDASQLAKRACEEGLRSREIPRPKNGSIIANGRYERSPAEMCTFPDGGFDAAFAKSGLEILRQTGKALSRNFTSNSSEKERGLPRPHRLSDWSQNFQKFKFGNYLSPHEIWEHFTEKWRSYSSVLVCILLFDPPQL